MTCSHNTGTPRTPREIKTYFTYCPMCLNEGDELVLGLTVRYLSKDGELLAYGHPGGEVAKYLMDIGKEYDFEVVDESELLPAIDICSNCKDLLDQQALQFAKDVAAGGVRWFCDVCKKAGVIMANDSKGFCNHVRKETKIFAPDIVTVKFNKCEQHASIEDVHTEVQ